MTVKRILYGVLAIFLMVMLCIAPVVATGDGTTEGGDTVTSPEGTAYIAITAPGILYLDTIDTIEAVCYDASGNPVPDAQFTFDYDQDILIIYMDETGTCELRPVNAGTTTITVSLSDDYTVSSSHVITVEEPAVRVDALDGYGNLNLTLDVEGKQFDVSASDGATHTWSWEFDKDSDTTVVSIEQKDSGSGSFLVSPLKEGQTKIIVTSDDGLTREIPIYVEKTIITSYSFSGSGVEYTDDENGVRSYTLSCSMDTTSRFYINGLMDQFGNSLPLDSITWSTAPGTGKVTFNENPEKPNMIFVVPVEKGTATLTATSTSNPLSSATIQVEVIEGTKNLQIGSCQNINYNEETQVYELSTRADGSLSAVVVDQFGITYTSYDTIEWESSNKDVLTVVPVTDINNPNRKATVTAHAAGTATVTVKSGDLTPLTLSFKVEETDVASVYFTASNEEKSFGLSCGNDDSEWIYVYDQFGNYVYGDTISVTSSNEDVLVVDPTSVTIKKNDNYYNHHGYVHLLTQEIEDSVTLTLSLTSVEGKTFSETYTVTVEEPKITSLSFEDYPDNLSPGATNEYVRIYVYDQFHNYMSRDGITISSSNPSVLTVDSETGKLTPKGAGTATITVTPPAGSTANPITCTISVSAETIVSDIDFRCDQELSVDSDGYAYAYVLDQFGNDLPSETVTWKVEDTTILTLSESTTKSGENNRYVAKNEGTTTISATSGSYTKTHIITVEQAKPTRLSISCPMDPDEESLFLSLSAGTNINAYVSDQHGRSIDNLEVQWNVIQNGNVIDLEKTSYNSNTRYVKPLSEGTATVVVTYTSGSVSLEDRLTVIVDGESVPTSISGIIFGEGYAPTPKPEQVLETDFYMTTAGYCYVNVYVYDQYDHEISDAEISWNIGGDSNILERRNLEEATSTYARFSPKGTGTATITASVPNTDLTKTFTVSVEAVEEKLTVTGTEQLSFEAIGSVHARVTDQYDAYLSNEPISFEVTQGSDLISIIEEDNRNNYLTIKSTGTAEGTVVITASTVGGLTDTISIEIVETTTRSLEVVGDINPQGLPKYATTMVFVYVLDQFGNVLPDETVKWNVVSGGDAIEFREDPYDSGTIYLTAKEEADTVKISVTSVNYPELTEEIEFSVVPSELSLGISGSQINHMSQNSEKTVHAYVTARPVGSTDGGYRVEDVKVDWTVESENGEVVIDTNNGIYRGVDDNFALLYATSAGDVVVHASAVVGDTILTAEQKITVHPASETQRTPPSLDATPSHGIYLSKDAVEWVNIWAYDQYYNRLREDVSVSVSDENVLKYTEDKSIGIITLDPQTTGTATVTLGFVDGSTAELSVIIDETELSGVSLGYIEKSTVGKPVTINAAAIDQYNCPLPNEELILEYDTAKLKVEKVTIYGIPAYLTVTPLVEGKHSLTATVKDTEFTKTITFIAYASDEETLIPVMPPKFSEEGRTFSEEFDVTITADAGAIFYTTNGETPVVDSTKAESTTPVSETIHITDTTTIQALVVKDGTASEVVKVTFIKDNPKTEYSIFVPETVTHGSISVDLEKAKTGDLVKVTFASDDGYVLSGWTIAGQTSGDVTEKSSAITSFAMWSEDVTLSATFVPDGTPVASSVKIFRTPDRLYAYENIGDAGTLSAIVYDQFGKEFTDTVIWSSDKPDVLTINSATGEYTAKSAGQVVITAAAASSKTAKATVTLVVDTPQKPAVTNLPDLGNVEFGVMSDAIHVITQYASYLNWDWGDDSTFKMKVSYPYPYYGLSDNDYISHTFVEYGELEVKVIPSNPYRTGDAETFTVNVIHAIPTNLVITSGPKSVTAGDTATYTAFATNAHSYKWYLNGAEITGQTGSTAKITFPDTLSGAITIKVEAYNVDNVKSGTDAEKVVNVAQKAGPLGNVEGLTTTPAYPVVGELTTFNIATVTNAVQYLWEFSDGAVYTTTAPAVQHTLKVKDGNTVKVTAYNSAGNTKDATFNIENVGEKPTVKITHTGTLEYGSETTFTADSTETGTYTWYIDGEKVGTGNSYKVNAWVKDQVGTHTISVTLETTYGKATATESITVQPKTGEKPIIHKVNGKTQVREGNMEKYHVIVHSKDEYSITWYLNGKEVQTENVKNNKDPKFLEHTFTEIGQYTLEVEVVTSPYGEIDTETIIINVIDKGSYDSNKAKKADKKAEQTTSVSPQLTEGTSEKNSLEAVSGLSFDQRDLNEDGEQVSVSITALDKGDLKGFTNDMGSKDNILLGLDIDPEGLKNEKDLSSYAVLTVKLPVSEVGNDPSLVAFYRYDTGSDINGWERLESSYNPTPENGFWIFTIKTGGMSHFVGTFSGSVTPNVETPPASSSPSSSPSSSSQGSSTWLQETPTETPTQTPTDTVPTVIPSTQPTSEPSSPGFGVLAILAILAGLGAVAVLRRR